MQVAFGSPGHKGVTHLMAVGADEDPSTTQADAKIKLVLGGAAIVTVASALLGIKTTRNAGAGAVAALLLVQHYLRKPRVVAVTQPAVTPIVPTPTSYY